MKPTTQARRVIFIDLARALAVVMMVYGHTGDALLGRSFRAGVVVRRLAVPARVATRQWGAHIRFTRSLFHRIRRFTLFVFPGYVLHFPVDHIAKLRSHAASRGFVAMDVLQPIGVTLIAHASRRLMHLPHSFGAVASGIAPRLLRLSLHHLWIGLEPRPHALFADGLHPGATLVVILLLLTAMAALAWEWNRLKHCARARRNGYPWVAVALLFTRVV